LEQAAAWRRSSGMFGEFGRKQEKCRKSALTGELPDVD